MPPQPRSGIKPDPTMLLCYVPDLVFTLICDAPHFVIVKITADNLRAAFFSCFFMLYVDSMNIMSYNEY